MTRFGAIAIVGAPNAGKSTLLNRLVGQPIAIVSRRPQSTRLPVVGLRSDEEAQALLVDTPGVLDPGYALHEAMRATIIDALRDADVVLHIVDATRPEQHLALTQLLADGPPLRAPIVVAANKADLPGAQLDAIPGAVPISALDGRGVDALWQRLRALLPEGDFQHDPEELSTQPMRFFVGEAIREAAFEQFQEELPYAIHSEVEEFREQGEPVYIRVTVYVERDSQKGIVVGQGGRALRTLGETARKKLETLLGARVYLDLWIKVLKDWRRNPAALRRLGFQLPENPRD